jgi:hypothetical protein
MTQAAPLPSRRLGKAAVAALQDADVPTRLAACGWASGICRRTCRACGVAFSGARTATRCRNCATLDLLTA